MNFAKQQQYDRLASTIGSEAAVREQLAIVEAEIQKTTEALRPLEHKRAELAARLRTIEQAKVEAAALKQPLTTAQA